MYGIISEEGWNSFAEGLGMPGRGGGTAVVGDGRNEKGCLHSGCGAGWAPDQPYLIGSSSQVCGRPFASSFQNSLSGRAKVQKDGVSSWKSYIAHKKENPHSNPGPYK